MYTRRERRRGAIAPLTAVLLIPLTALLAFAVDLGWVTHTHNELQAAADAAALAGAAQLTDDFVNYHLPGLDAEKKAALRASASTRARTYAKNYAANNAAGGVASLRLLDADIELGFTSSTGTYTALPGYTGYPNTVKVVLRRDGSANGALGLFFARVLGQNSVNLTATATATIYAGTIDGFRTDTTSRSRILPMTYDVNDWNSFVTNQYAGKNWISVDNDADGLPRVSVYPTLSDRGNFGQLSLDQGNNGASVIRDWIAHGVSGTDLQAQYVKGLLPLSQHSPMLPPDWKGNPGLKDSTIQEVGDHVGELFLLPLYKPVNDNSVVAAGTSTGNGNGKGKGKGGSEAANPAPTYQAGSGQGSNFYYTIVQFVGIRISAVDSKGGTKAIKVQPSALIDPNAIPLGSSIAPAAPPSATNPLPTVFVGAKLVR